MHAAEELAPAAPLHVPAEQGVHDAWLLLDQVPGKHVWQNEEPAELMANVEVAELGWDEVPAGQLLHGGIPFFWREYWPRGHCGAH